MQQRELTKADLTAVENLLQQADDRQSRLLLIEDILAHQGFLIGAFNKDELLGVAILDRQYISGFRLRLADFIMKEPLNREVMQNLLQLILQEARRKEAEALYICSTNESALLEFYRQNDALPPQKPDFYLAQLYDENEHIEIKL